MNWSKKRKQTLTWIINHDDQKIQLPTINKEPFIQFLGWEALELPSLTWMWVVHSFIAIPLYTVMIMAPPTHTMVPKIFAWPDGLLIPALSNLKSHNSISSYIHEVTLVKWKKCDKMFLNNSIWLDKKRNQHIYLHWKF